VSATFFDTLVFGEASGTVHDYFDEISYSQIDLLTLKLPSRRAGNGLRGHEYCVDSACGTGAYLTTPKAG
jgi:hypothetical protein